MFYFLDIVWMHIGCASFTICFFLIQSSFCADLFPATSYGFLQSSLEILQSLKNGSQVKISKNLEFSGLPKTKKISLSPVGTFHISTKSQPPFTLPVFFVTKRSSLKLCATLPSWIYFTWLFWRFVRASSTSKLDWFGKMTQKG